MDHDKLASTVLHLVRGCQVKPGLTRLLKMIYFADYRHFQKHLSPITGAPYVAMERGPVIDEYWDVFKDLEREGLVKVEEVPMAGHPGHRKQEFVALAEPNRGIFSETELEVLASVIRDYGGMSGAELSNETHQEGPWSFIWDAKHPGRPIPYTAFRWIANLPDENDIASARAIIGKEEVASQVVELNGIG